jgi:voltage-gated potassium channel
LSGITLGEAGIRDQYNLVVLAIRHQDGRLDFNPKPAQAISAGDSLIVMGNSQSLKNLELLAGVKE